MKADTLATAHISSSSGCVQLPAKTSKHGTTWTANWGKQIVVGGADHFLGVQVIKYTPAVFATGWGRRRGSRR